MLYIQATVPLNRGSATRMKNEKALGEKDVSKVMNF